MSSESGSSDPRPDKKQKALTDKTVPDDDVMSSSLLSKGQPIFNIRPSYFDALVLQISQFLATNTANIPNDIIEVAFGPLVEQGTGARILFCFECRLKQNLVFIWRNEPVDDG